MDSQENNSSCSNSYLQETDYNSDIDSDIRREIDYKFISSKTNSKYIFPRVSKIQIKPKIIQKKPGIFNIQRKTSKETFSLNNSIVYQRKPLPLLKKQEEGGKIRNLSFTMNHRKNIRSIEALPLKFKHSPYLKPLVNISKGKSVKNLSSFIF